MKQFLLRFIAALVLLTAFALWTLMASQMDVQPIGPMNSQVGLAGMNQFVHSLTGVHLPLYTITDWLGLIPIGICGCFALLGLRQWVQRRRIRLVDRSLLALGGFYLLVMAAYLLFEGCVINYRPVLIDGRLEASYPSSTTMLVLCVTSTAAMQLRVRIRSRPLRHAVIIALAVFAAGMVLARLISGVHWLSDIIGAVLLSAALVMLYAAAGGLHKE